MARSILVGVDPPRILTELDLDGAAFAVPVAGGDGVGFHEDNLVTPASVMKVQVALTIENAIATGGIDGSERRSISPDRRTPGPIGISLMRDEVSLSVRDLVLAMLTISDNAAADELIGLVGLDQINQTTRDIGMVRTRIASTLGDMLDSMASDVGFSGYAALEAHGRASSGSGFEGQIRCKVGASAALDPSRGSCTTARETAALLKAIWSDQAGPPQACAEVRKAMARQLTRQRIASGFGPSVTVAAKSGGLAGIIRNEAGVIAFPDGAEYAVAVFTRADPAFGTNPALIDAAIGGIARTLVNQLRA